MSEREIQTEGRWKSNANKVYIRSNTADASQVSRKLAKYGIGSLETTGPGHHLGQTATVADELGF